MLPKTVKLMGRPQAELDSGVVPFSEDKRYLLLAYVAHSGDWVSREHLAYLFWSDSDSTAARKNLRHLLTRVRALEWGPELEGEREHLRWQVATDTAAFQQAYARADWPEAVRAFGGVLLHGFSADDAPEFAAWLETERESLTQRWRGAVLQHSAALELSGKAGQGLELLETLLEFNPLDEEALERYMQTAARVGETRQALRVYGRFADLLKQELNLPPTLNLERLADSIRQKGQTLVLEPKAVPAPPAQPPHLPVVPTPFVGRDLELAEVANYLQQPECRLLTLTGPGGVGKSRMALQAALEQAPGHPGGVYFVMLDSLDAPEQIPLRIAEALRLTLQGADPPLEQVKRSIGEQAMLLVLDNYEHLLAGVGIVTELLEACPRLRLLATSRTRLNLSYESVMPLDGLALPQSGASWEEARQSDAVNLLVQRAQQVRPDFALGPDNLRWVLEICRQVEGFPLALELAAAWVRTLPLEEIAQQVARNLDLMVSSSRDSRPRHRSMEAVFDHSWRLLSEGEQTALRRLSVFFGGFRTEAIRQVSATPLPVLAALVDKSLLRLSPAGRYDRHALLYQYMQQKLAEHPAEEGETRSNHSQYYLRFLSRALGEIRGPDSKKMLETLEEELGNLRLAWTWALGAGRIQAVKEASEALMRFFDARGRYQEGIEMFEEARQALDSGASRQNSLHPAALGTVLVFLGKFQQRLRRHAAAEQTTRIGLDLLRSLPIPEPEPLIWGLGTLGTLANLRGQNQASLAHRLEALEKAKEIANPRLIAVCSGWVAIGEDALGNHAEAIRHYREAIFLFKKQGNRIGTLYNTSDLGALLMDLGRFEEARPLLQEALEECRASGELMIQAETLMGLSRCHLQLGQPGPAWECAEEALRLAAQYPRQYDEVRLYALLSQVAVARGQSAQAQGFFVRALDKAWEDRQIPEVLEVLCGWAVALGVDSLEAQKVLRLIAEHPEAFEADREQARAVLGAAVEGEALTLEGAVEHFLYR